MPMLIGSSISSPLRRKWNCAVEPGASRAMVLSTWVVSCTGVSSMLTNTSPVCTPAFSAGPLRITPAMMAPFCCVGSCSASVSSGVRSCGSTPMYPRITRPWRMIWFMTSCTMEMGMAKPMPSEPPLRE